MKERVLVVEDEAIVQLDIKNRLLNLGYQIVGTAAYGEDAVRIAREVYPDIVLMDIGLKGKIDGVEAAEQIKAQCNIPIIYMTANSDYTTLQRAKITGPFGYILKPFDEREMRTTIEMALYKHKLDAEMNETRHWLETILNSISDAVISTNSQMQVTFMNPAAEAMTQWKAAEAAGKDFHEIVRVINPGTGVVVDRQTCIDIMLNTGVSTKCNQIMVDRQGSTRPIECSITILKGDKGRPDGAVLTFRDVTEREKVEKALRESEDKFSRAFMFNPLPMTISRLDDGRFQDVNNSFVELFGFTREEALGKISTDLGILSHEDRAKMIEQIRTNGRISNIRIAFRNKSGILLKGVTSYEVILVNGEKRLLAIFTPDLVKEAL